MSVDCNDISLIVETENLTREDEKSHQNYYSQVISSNRVLDWTPVDEYSKTLTANAVSTVDLDSVVGKCAGFVVIVRETGATNTNNKLFEYVDLGDTAQIDFITNGGKSILGSGVPLDAKYLRDEIWATHFSTNFNSKKNAYFIPFTQDAKNALHGVVDGYVTLNSSGHKLQIKPPAVASLLSNCWCERGLQPQATTASVFEENRPPLWRTMPRQQTSRTLLKDSSRSRSTKDAVSP